MITSMSELTKICEEQANRIRNERMWIEATCMLFHIDEAQLFQAFQTFLIHCVSGGEDIATKTIKDIKHHFRSYLYGNIHQRTTVNGNPISAIQQREADFAEYFGGQLSQGW